MRADLDEAFEFLSTVYEGVPGHLWIGAFEPSPAGQCFRGVGAIDYIDHLDRHLRPGIYARVTTLATVRAFGRGSVADSLALPGMWGDIDIAGPGHKHDGPLPLPPDEDAARAIVAASSLPEPSMWIHSGGGLYPWWLLDEPADLSDEGVRQAWTDISRCWQKALADAAADAGYHYGAQVGDLARVLRIPGTVNRKAGLERPCRIIDRNDFRYTTGDFVNAVPPPAPAPAYTPSPGTGRVTITPGVSPLDAFEEVADWADALLLGGLGWEEVRRGPGGERRWKHPAATNAMSATTSVPGERDRLFVFSDNTLFPANESITKGFAYALIHHGGDLAAAATALRAAGYGDGAGQGSASARNAADVAALVGETGAAAALVADDDGLSALVAAEVRKLFIRREAKRQVEAAEHAMSWREPEYCDTLGQELARPRQPVNFLIDRVWPAGHNVLLIAQYKAGKTTLCANVVKALADGEPFLGKFEVAPFEGNIGYLNLELGREQFADWMRAQGIVNVDRVHPMTLRGYSMPPIFEHTRNYLIGWLKRHQIAVLVVDPFARAFTGCGDENSSADVGAFLDAYDQIKTEAGVRELILPAHSGRAEAEAGKEHAKGSTRLDDWADARWLLTREGEARFLSATGRDVEVAEEQLHFSANSRRLTFGGPDRFAYRQQNLIAEMLRKMRAGDTSLSKSDIGSLLPMRRNESVVELINEALARGLLKEEKKGSYMHYRPAHRLDDGR